ncbi:NrtR DNA-binding winged helix domain-containing protein [Methyloraptor flagellatus]|uniref:NAD regulator n=1 Tax=Methyloraptor flagellatus TaxID=3162530 RepID=A0AAU7X5F1_9HYPH
MSDERTGSASVGAATVGAARATRISTDSAPESEIAAGAARPGVEIGLSAAVVAVADDTPLILTMAATQAGGGEPAGVARPDPAEDGRVDALPFGPFDPVQHRTFEIGLRAWVEAQTALRLGYAEQLYTFGDRGRHARLGDTGPHVVSVGYLALTRKRPESDAALAREGAAFRPWYDYFPWEDWRGGRPALIDEAILPALADWAARPSSPTETARGLGRPERVRMCFGGEGADGGDFDEEKALERYELLYEAGLVREALRDGRPAALARPDRPFLGRSMRFDHRRILATAISRLRSKLKYRPVVFELMGDSFTLTELQRSVEAIGGRHLHKQNFRRLVDQSDLVEATGETSLVTGGRPAQLYRFRRDVLSERPAPGLRYGARV